MRFLADPLRRLVEQPLRLLPTEAVWELHDAADEHLLATLYCARRSARAIAGGGTTWTLHVERTRERRQLVARDAAGEPAARYVPGAIHGGRLWAGAGSWGKLRRTPLRWDESWGLSVDREELVRVWPALPELGYEIVVGAACLRRADVSLLLVPFLCWIVMTEQAVPGPVTVGA